MISSLVLGLGLVGHFGDRFRDAQVYSEMIASLDQTVFHTKEHLSAAISSKPDGFEALWSMLDLNEDGQIDQFELVVQEVEGAHMVGMQLGTSEALALAGGAVLEDGDLSKPAIDCEHFQSWFVDNAWASYLELADKDGDGQLNDSEWRLVNEASLRFAEQMHRREADDLPSGGELLEADIHVPGSMPEALIQAGYVYNQVLAKNKCDGEGTADGVGTAGGVRRRLQGREYSMMNSGRNPANNGPVKSHTWKPVDERPMWYWIPGAPYTGGYSPCSPCAFVDFVVRAWEIFAETAHDSCC